MRLRLPHPFVLLIGGVALAAALTWVLPAGIYERQLDPLSDRELVVPGTYHRVDAAPVGPFAAALAVPRGIVDAADVVVVILVVAGAFVLLDRTGALGRLIGALVGRFRHRPLLVLAAVSFAFSALGALANLHEEVIALVPILLVLSRGLGFGAVTALSMSIGAAVVGSAFGPTNPFQVGIAHKVAQMPLLDGAGLRLVLFVVATALWIWWTASQAKRDDVRQESDALPLAPPTARDGILLAVMLVPFAVYVWGVLRLDWGFNELSALFLVAGVVVGLVGRLGLRGTAEQYLEGMAELLPAAMLVGVARGISVVLTDGRIIDTILHALATPLSEMPGLLAAALMVPFHALLHVPVPTVSGQAVLTMPIMAPLADLLGFPRTVAVLAYQTGAGLMDMVSPTNGALLAMLLAAKVSYGRWLRFALPGCALVALVGLAGMAIAAID